MKINKIKIAMCTFLVVSLLTSTAFAGEVKSEAATSSNVISEGTTVQQTEDKYMMKTGTIVDIAKDKEIYQVEVKDSNNSIIFNLSEDVFVFDQGTNKILQQSNLAKDMQVCVIMKKNAPMTMSLPPQTSGAVGIIVMKQGASVDLSVYDDQFVNAENTLRLNISNSLANTEIYHISGLKPLKTGDAATDMAFKADAIKGKEAVVLYTASTKSIPAITTPETVIILTDDGTKVEKPEPKSTEYVTLREKAEAKGYEVKWVSNTMPITLIKQDMEAKIVLGSDELIFTHKTKDIKPLDMMTKLDRPAVLQNGKTMVPQSFIDALE